jgi:hypothetical protein
VKMLQASLGMTGGGEVYGGSAVKLMFNDPLTDSRTPDIIVTPNVGVVYTGGKGKVSEHGGFANDDTSVMLLVSNPVISAATYEYPVRTAQVAPTVVAALGLNPQALDGVLMEGTPVLPGVSLDSQPNVVIAPIASGSVPSVSLDASHSTDPNGLPLTFLWTNSSHNAVLYNATSAIATAAAVNGKGAYTFAVTVTNSAGVSATGTVTYNYTGH